MTLYLSMISLTKYFATFSISLETANNSTYLEKCSVIDNINVFLFFKIGNSSKKSILTILNIFLAMISCNSLAFSSLHSFLYFVT
jgi:hypothetical protein